MVNNNKYLAAQPERLQQRKEVAVEGETALKSPCGPICGQSATSTFFSIL